MASNQEVTLTQEKSMVYVQVDGGDLVRINLENGEVLVWDRLADYGSQPAWVGTVDLTPAT